MKENSENLVETFLLLYNQILSNKKKETDVK